MVNFFVPILYLCWQMKINFSLANLNYFSRLFFSVEVESIFCVGVCENNNQQFVWNYASFFRPVQCFMWKRMQPAPSTFFHYTFFWRSVQTQTVACWHWMQQPRIYFVCKNVRLSLVEKGSKIQTKIYFYEKW